MPRDHCRDWLNCYIVKTADDFRFDDSAGTPRTLWILGSRGCQPVGLGSLQRPAIRDHGDNSRKNIAGKLPAIAGWQPALPGTGRSEEHTSELQSRFDLVCRLLLE